MKTLPANLLAAKNIFGQDSCWLMLLTIVLPAPVSTTYRIVPNNENVTFQSNPYTAFPVEMDLPKESSTGEIPYLTLRVSNVTRVLQGHIETLNGAHGTTIRMVIVNVANLGEDYTELTVDFEVLNTTCNAQWVVFKCGTFNPLRRRLLDKYFALHCNHHFNSPAVRASGDNTGCECGYTGSDTTCKRTLEACVAKNNSAYFGGFPGLENGGIRFA
jgi:hypothetical protein